MGMIHFRLWRQINQAKNHTINKKTKQPVINFQLDYLGVVNISAYAKINHRHKKTA